MAIITADRNNMDHVDPRPDPAERRRPAGLRIPRGGIYESGVLDPVWPGRPAIIQASAAVSRAEILDSGARRVRGRTRRAVIVTWGIQTSERRF